MQRRVVPEMSEDNQKEAEGNIPPEQAKPKKGYSGAIKRHHDYFMDESKEHAPEDQPNIDLALERERTGLIEPIDLSKPPENKSENTSGD